MRKNLALCLAFFISFSVVAQNTSTPSIFKSFDYSAIFGTSISNMYGDVGNNRYILMPNLGICADSQLANGWNLRIEPHVSVEGQHLNGGHDKIVYLNLPVMFTKQYIDNLSYDLGLGVAAKLTEQTKFARSNTKENRNRFKRVNPFVVVGSRYDVNEDWFAQFRCHVKTPDVVRKEGGDSEGSIILNFQLMLGYQLGNRE